MTDYVARFGMATVVIAVVGFVVTTIIFVLDMRDDRRAAKAAQHLSEDVERVSVDLETSDGALVHIENLPDHPAALRRLCEAIDDAVLAQREHGSAAARRDRATAHHGTAG